MSSSGCLLFFDVKRYTRSVSFRGLDRSSSRSSNNSNNSNKKKQGKSQSTQPDSHQEERDVLLELLLQGDGTDSNVEPIALAQENKENLDPQSWSPFTPERVDEVRFSDRC